MLNDHRKEIVPNTGMLNPYDCAQFIRNTLSDGMNMRRNKHFDEKYKPIFRHKKHNDAIDAWLSRNKVWRDYVASPTIHMEMRNYIPVYDQAITNRIRMGGWEAKEIGEPSFGFEILGLASNNSDNHDSREGECVPVDMDKWEKVLAMEV